MVVLLVNNSVSLVLLLEEALPLLLDYVQKVGAGRSLISLHVGAVSFICVRNERINLFLCIFKASPEVVVSPGDVQVNLGRTVFISCDVTSVNGGDQVIWYKTVNGQLEPGNNIHK